jgi:hypothetical protein
MGMAAPIYYAYTAEQVRAFELALDELFRPI